MVRAFRKISSSRTMMTQVSYDAPLLYQVSASEGAKKKRNRIFTRPEV